jgi:hypothetical protein
VPIAGDPRRRHRAKFSGGEQLHGVESDADGAAFIEMFEAAGSESQQDRRRQHEVLVVAKVQVQRCGLRFLRAPRTADRLGGEQGAGAQLIGEFAELAAFRRRRPSGRGRAPATREVLQMEQVLDAQCPRREPVRSRQHHARDRHGDHERWRGHVVFATARLVTGVRPFAGRRRCHSRKRLWSGHQSHASLQKWSRGASQKRCPASRCAAHVHAPRSMTFLSRLEAARTLPVLTYPSAQ